MIRSCNWQLVNQLWFDWIMASLSFLTKPAHTVLVSLHWLPVSQRIIYKTAVLVWKCLHDAAPCYLADLCVPAHSVSGRQQLGLCWSRTPGLLLVSPPVSAVVYAAAEWWLSTVRPAPLWLFSEFGTIYKYSDLLTYLHCRHPVLSGVLTLSVMCTTLYCSHADVLCVYLLSDMHIMMSEAFRHCCPWLN